MRFINSKTLLSLGVITFAVCFLFLVFQFSLPVIRVYAAPLAQKPVNNWYVCRDLGYGYVPGLGDYRQRLKLCHDGEGWEVYTYCTQPWRPAPPVGRVCTRINSDSYRCGNNFQLVREYRILQTPTITMTPFLTMTPTVTQQVGTQTPIQTQIQLQTQTPILTLTPRNRPGGDGNLRQPGYYVGIEIAILIFSILGVYLLFRLKTS